MGEYKRIEHTFSPIYDSWSEILILGSLPSVKSRENGFYYGHPQNRFWKVLAYLFDWELPVTNMQKKQMLLENHIAIWDVIQSCDIIGSSDSSIKNVEPTKVSTILEECNVKTIYANGKTAGKLYREYTKEKTRRDIIELPSTSPANAMYRLEDLIEEWSIIKNRMRD